MATQQGANATITDGEREEVDATNASGRQPVVFVHGLWLLASSWDRWADVFRDAGFATLQPGWREVAETALEFVRRFVPAGEGPNGRVPSSERSGC